MSTARNLVCVDCGRDWAWTGRRIRRDVRCPTCRVLNERRVEIREHLDQLVTTDRGARVAAVAMAAAHRADATRPGTAGPAAMSSAVHRLARSGAVDERTRQARLLDVAAAAIVWAAEIAGALDG